MVHGYYVGMGQTFLTIKLEMNIHKSIENPSNFKVHPGVPMGFWVPQSPQDQQTAEAAKLAEERRLQLQPRQAAAADGSGRGGPAEARAPT